MRARFCHARGITKIWDIFNIALSRYGQPGLLKTSGGRKKTFTCWVFLRLNKTTKKAPSKSSAIAEGAFKKKSFYGVFSYVWIKPVLFFNSPVVNLENFSSTENIPCKGWTRSKQEKLWLTVTQRLKRARSWGLVCVMRRSKSHLVCARVACLDD